MEKRTDRKRGWWLLPPNLGLYMLVAGASLGLIFVFVVQVFLRCVM
ncbi:MAG: hypothetical protein ACR2QS_00310 [Woeseiaceae bacterium]